MKCSEGGGDNLSVTNETILLPPPSLLTQVLTNESSPPERGGGHMNLFQYSVLFCFTSANKEFECVCWGGGGTG